MKKLVFLSAIDALYKKKEVDVTDHLKTVEGEEIDDTLVETLFKQFDSEKVERFKTEATERFNNGVKKGEKTKAQFFEKKLREVFKVDSSLEGDELLTHIEENLPEPGKGSGSAPDLSKISDEDLLKVPAFIKKQRDFNTALKLKDTEKEQAIQAEQEKQTQTQILSEASNKALAILDGKKPILPQDPTKAQTLKNKLLIDELKGQRFMKSTDGSLIPLDAEGKQLEDSNGNAVDFDRLVGRIIDSNFEFNVSDQRQSPNNKNQQQQQQSEKKVWKGKAPANKNEYMELLLDDQFDTDQRVALKEQYSEQFSG